MMAITLLFLLFSSALLFGNTVLKLYGKKKQVLSLNLLLLALLSLSSLYMLLSGTDSVVAGMISVDPFSAFFALLFTLGMILVHLLAYQYSEDYPGFALLSCFTLAGMYLVSLSTTIITIFVGLELASIPTVFMILLSKKSLEAAAKLFIMASIATAIFSLAMALAYGGSNTLSLTHSQESSLMLFAALLFIAALGFESSIFPFNLLIPDVYQGSPAYLTSMLGGINKKMGFSALIQILILVFIAYKSAFAVIAIASVLTMFYGNIVAMMQKNIKRMLAYSSIAQAGYILIGVATGTQSGIAASLFQIFSHLFIFIGLMGIVAWLEDRNRHDIDALIGLHSENRLAAFSLALFLLSLVGLPFTSGFIGKFLIFTGAIGANLAILAVIGIINSVISVYYYARPIMAAYTGKADPKPAKLSAPVLITITVCIVATLLFGIFPQPLVSMASHASSYLFR